MTYNTTLVQVPRTIMPMPAEQEPDDQVTAWIRSLESGDQEAATDLWAYCFPRLLQYSKRKLPDHLRRALDEEDVALSAFTSFCLGSARQVLGVIHSRDELWKLLYCITARKAQAYVRHQTRQKRGGGQVSGESVFLGGKQENSHAPGIDQIAGQPDSPISKDLFASQCEHLFDLLEDETLQTIALLRVEGYSIDEIAQRVGCAKRSVERRLNLIRTIWQSAEQ